MKFLTLFTEDQIPEVESEFSKVIDSGIKEPTKIVNTVLSNTLNSKIFIADAITPTEKRQMAIEYVKSLLNIPIKNRSEESAPPIPELQRIEIDPEFQSLITPLRPEELHQLEESIKTEGCRDPLVLWGNILLDGHNRHAICQRNGKTFTTVQADVKDRDEARLWIIKNQLGRRNLTNYDRGLIALKLKEALQQKAKKNQGTRTDLLQNSVKGYTPVNIQKELATVAGMSHDTLYKIEKIEEKATPELKEQLRQKKTSINQAYIDVTTITGMTSNEIEKIEKIEQEAPAELREQVKKGNITVNKACHKIKQAQNYQEKKEANFQECKKGKYDVIYADPPWCYDNAQIRGSAEDQYPVMTIQEICDLPVKDFTATNAILFLWTTNPQLERAFEVIKAWGFEYKTNFVRIKNNQTGGFHNFGKHELLLIATKGTHMTPEPGTLRNSVIHDPEDFKVEHSKKPDLYYDLIEKEYPGRKYLELFARAQRPGWEIFSNELTLRAA